MTNQRRVFKTCLTQTKWLFWWLDFTRNVFGGFALFLYIFLTCDHGTNYLTSILFLCMYKIIVTLHFTPGEPENEWQKTELVPILLLRGAKVCTSLVWYSIDREDQENESIFLYKRRIARLDQNYKELYQTKRTTILLLLAFFMTFSLLQFLSKKCYREPTGLTLFFLQKKCFLHKKPDSFSWSSLSIEYHTKNKWPLVCFFLV